MRLSGVRAPLMLLGPWLKLKERPERLPPRVPGTRFAIKIGLRPFNSRASICSRVTSRCTDADSVWSGADDEDTSTDSLAAPTVKDASTVNVELASSLLPVLPNFLKPEACTLSA